MQDGKTKRRSSPKRIETAIGVAYSIESMAEMATPEDAMQRLRVIRVDAQRIARLLAPREPTP